MPKNDGYLTWNDDAGQKIALAEAAKAYDRPRTVVRRATASNIFDKIGPGNVSVRDGFNRRDYEEWRLDEARPLRSKDQVLAAMRLYESEGLVYNIINLMADFATKGIGLVHQNPRQENWWKEWFKQVSGPSVSERFVNYLIRCGVVLPRRQTAKISVKIQQGMQRAGAEADLDPREFEPEIRRREIPWGYTFLNPLTISVVGEDVATFIGQDYYQFALQVPLQLANKIKNPKPHEKQTVSNIPADIRRMIQGGLTTIPLDPDKVSAYFYKKDDWRVWSMPMVCPILKDLHLLEKMKLADLAALDGVISTIRVWKLGRIDANVKMLPSEAIINRLAEMLENNVGGGVMDLVWGPDIELVETNTNAHHFLGEAKYGPVLRAVYQGLGIPTAAGGGERSGGFNADFFSLKILIDRMEYVRNVVRQFWEWEVSVTQKAMGFRFPARLIFDHMDLSDPAHQRKLWIDLADRDFMSWETLIHRFGEDPDVEAARLRREYKQRKDGRLPPKASPYHDPQQDFGLKKIFAQTGSVTPSEVGLTLEEPTPGEETPAEHTAKLAPEPAAGPPGKARPKGPSGQGRPKGSLDSSKRKQKRVSPRTSAAVLEAVAWAETAQSRIREVASTAYLKQAGKRNLRELTAAENRAFEDFTFRVLFQVPYGTDVDEAAVRSALSSPLEIPGPAMDLFRKSVALHAEKRGREPSLETTRRFQSGVYAFWNCDDAGDSADGLPQVP